MKTLMKLLAAATLLVAVHTTASAEEVEFITLSECMIDGSNWGAIEDVLANCPEYTELVTAAAIAYLAEKLPIVDNWLGQAWIDRVENCGIVVPPEVLALLQPPPEE